MERGVGFHRYRRHAKSSSASTMVLPNDSNNNTTCNGDQQAPPPPPPPPCMVREQDQYMPIANVIRIMRRILPSHAKISDDAKETIQECVSEYISFITGEANERCQREQRKTVTAEDVLWAMGKLGFDDYIEPLTVYLNRYREAENERNTSHGDQLLFLKRGMEINHHGPIGMPPPYGSGYPMGHFSGMLDAAAAMGGGGYYRDLAGSGASSTAQNALASFDPFVQFK
ncbi:nuclear transcription factor Y subunit B-9-like [Corylus avellana]|uniref:nuclear transcription factor Y subunit B-9-like n=1 Tax=Corylus avellana TaxID=13451 RepID=UPI00286A4BFE|nr:nuclear transcription factor Y subunit B-9-like [Corylus avellana]